MNISSIEKKARSLWHEYGTMSNVVVAVALIIAASWAWGSVSTMQRNFALQKEVDAKRRELELTDLEVLTLQYQQNYYKSDEYKDLAAREHLGLASPGEKVLMLPKNSPGVIKQSKTEGDKATAIAVGSAPSNLQQWLNFFSGASAGNLQG
jgi:cell division protein FtsB